MTTDNDDELSTVQLLWRDRREEFEAYLNGKMGVKFDGHHLITNPIFDCPPERYTFVPKPSPPTLRPFTREEWIERRDWWVREKSWAGVGRICGISNRSVMYGSVSKTLKAMLETCEISPDCKTWYPCGMVEQQRKDGE